MGSNRCRISGPGLQTPVSREEREADRSRPSEHLLVGSASGKRRLKAGLDHGRSSGAERRCERTAAALVEEELRPSECGMRSVAGVLITSFNSIPYWDGI